MKKLSALLVVLASFSTTQIAADEFRARLVIVQGDVVVVNAKGEERKPEKNQFLINKMETVVTRDGGKAVVQFDDGALSVMEEKSSLRVEQSGWLSQLGGKIYYVFRKTTGKTEPKKVSTGFATIGIRGTTFIVMDTADGKSVALQTGGLNIESPGEDYAVVTPAPATDFNAFKQQMQEQQDVMKKEFEDYKTKTQKEFIEYKKSFDLEANRVVSFEGNRVTEKDLDTDFSGQFGSFESFAGQHVKAYRELDESVK